MCVLAGLGGWLEKGAPGGRKEDGLPTPASPQGGHPYLSGPPLPLANLLLWQDLPA